MSSLSTRSGTHHACPQGISSPLLRPRSSPVWGGGGAWPAGGQCPASIPALQLCPLVTSNTHTRGGSPFLPTGGAVRPAPSPLPASGSSGCAPEPRMRTHTYQAHRMYTYRTHARGRCARLPGTAAAPHALFPQRCSLPALSLSSLAVFTTGSSVRSLATSATWHHAVLEATPSRPTGLPGGICGLDTLPLPLPLGRAHPQKRLSPSRVGPAGFCRQPS